LTLAIPAALQENKARTKSPPVRGELMARSNNMVGSLKLELRVKGRKKGNA